VDVDLATHTINIDMPETERDACAREIAEQVGHMYA
jgi:hypothetical protein